MYQTTKAGRKFHVPDAAEDAAITQAAMSDADALPLTDDELAGFNKVGRPSLPDHEKKQVTTIRLSPDVMDYFKSSGKGWQSRIDDALKEYIASH